MKHDELEVFLKIGMPIALFVNSLTMCTFVWVYVRDWKTGGDSHWIGLVLIELFLLGGSLFFIWFMRSRWGWFRRK